MLPTPREGTSQTAARQRVALNQSVLDCCLCAAGELSDEHHPGWETLTVFELSAALSIGRWGTDRAERVAPSPYTGSQLATIEKCLGRSWTTAKCPVCHRVFHAVMRTMHGKKGRTVWLVCCARCERRAVLPARSGDGWGRAVGGRRRPGWLRAAWSIGAAVVLAWVSFAWVLSSGLQPPEMPPSDVMAVVPSLHRRVAVDPPGYAGLGELSGETPSRDLGLASVADSGQVAFAAR